MELARGPGWRTKGPPGREEAEAIAIQALGFLAAEPARLQRFLTLTGLSPQDLMASAGTPAMQASILEHLVGDESLLLMFATHCAIAPEHVEPARRALAAGAEDPRG